MASTLLRPWIGLTGTRTYTPELRRDMEEISRFLADLRAAVGKTIGESQTTNITITAVTSDTEIIAGAGLTGGGDLTADRTLAIDSSVLSAIAAAVNGSGTINKHARWVGATAIGNGLDSDDGTTWQVEAADSAVREGGYGWVFGGSDTALGYPGGIYFKGGDSLDTSAQGGFFAALAGDGSGTIDGGSIYFKSGNLGGNTGGQFEMFGGSTSGGGPVIFSAGNSAAGSGGTMNLYGGTGATFGGNIGIFGGEGVSGDAIGGAFLMQAGAGHGVGLGGGFTATSGQGGANANGGDFIMSSGAGGVTSGGGGSFFLTAGDGAGSGFGGQFSMTAGSGDAGGGPITVSSGSSTSGAAGTVTIRGGVGATDGGSINFLVGAGSPNGTFRFHAANDFVETLDFEQLSRDRTFTFPDSDIDMQAAFTGTVSPVVSITVQNGIVTACS